MKTLQARVLGGVGNGAFYYQIEAMTCLAYIYIYIFRSYSTEEGYSRYCNWRSSKVTEAFPPIGKRCVWRAVQCMKHCTFRHFLTRALSILAALVERVPKTSQILLESVTSVESSRLGLRENRELSQVSARVPKAPARTSRVSRGNSQSSGYISESLSIISDVSARAVRALKALSDSSKTIESFRRELRERSMSSMLSRRPRRKSMENIVSSRYSRRDPREHQEFRELSARAIVEIHLKMHTPLWVLTDEFLSAECSRRLMLREVADELQ